MQLRLVLSAITFGFAAGIGVFACGSNSTSYVGDAGLAIDAAYEASDTLPCRGDFDCDAGTLCYFTKIDCSVTDGTCLPAQPQPDSGCNTETVCTCEDVPATVCVGVMPHVRLSGVTPNVSDSGLTSCANP